MRKLVFAFISPILLLGLWGCAEQEREEGEAATIAAAAAISEIPITTASDEALAQFYEGQQLADDGRGLEAREAFLRAVQIDPDFGRGYLGVANNATSTTEFKEYLDLARTHSEDASSGEQILIDINMAFFENDVGRALELAEELVKRYPASPRAWLSLAGVYTALNRNEEARERARKALELDPDFPVAHSTLGFSYLFNEPKDFDQAARHFQQVVDLRPQEPQPLVNLGDAYRGVQDLEVARLAYGHAAELDPENEKAVYSVALLKKGHVNSFLGRFAEARNDFDRALAVTKPQQTSFYANYKAFTWVHEDKPQRAIAELQEIVDAAPGVTPADQVNAARVFALTNMAQIAMHHGLHDIAERAIRQRNEYSLEDARKTGDDDFIRGQIAAAAYWEGVLAARAGDYTTATTKAEENARLLEPDDNPRKLEPYHDLLGLVALRQGKFQEAVDHYNKANPNNFYTKYHLGLAHEGAGNVADAQRIFRDVFAYNFNSVGYALVRREAEAKIVVGTS